MKKLMFLILFISCVLLHTDRVFASHTVTAEEVESGNTLEQQLNALDFEQVDAIIDKSNSAASEFSLRELTLKAIKSELDLSPGSLVDLFVKRFFYEFLEHQNLIRRLIVIGILSAILNNLTSSFKNKSIGELGFYVSFVVLITVLFSSFQVASSLITGLISDLSSLMEASLPLMLTLVAMSGSVSGAVVFNSLMIMAISFITSFIKNIFIPVLIMASAVEIVNYLTGRNILSKMTQLIKNAASWSLKGITALFLGILSLQKISVPIMDNLAVKTAKASAGAVPVVGGLLGGALDTVLSFASAAKSGVLVAIIIVIIAACAVPILEMLAMMLVYKLTAAIVQPVCDDRIVECIDSIGSFTSLILSCGVTVVVMFLFSVMILLSF